MRGSTPHWASWTGLCISILRSYAFCPTSAAASPPWRIGSPSASRRAHSSSSSPPDGCFMNSGAKRYWTYLYNLTSSNIKRFDERFLQLPSLFTPLLHQFQKLHHRGAFTPSSNPILSLKPKSSDVTSRSSPQRRIKLKIVFEHHCSFE